MGHIWFRCCGVSFRLVNGKLEIYIWMYNFNLRLSRNVSIAISFKRWKKKQITLYRSIVLKNWISNVCKLMNLLRILHIMCKEIHYLNYFILSHHEYANEYLKRFYRSISGFCNGQSGFFFFVEFIDQNYPNIIKFMQNGCKWERRLANGKKYENDVNIHDLIWIHFFSHYIKTRCD